MARAERYPDVALGVECAWPLAQVRLERGAIVRRRDAAGSSVIAHAGEVWITEENSRRDVLLRAGESYRFSRSGLALIEACTDAAIAFSVP
jgi:hypothetical protein